MFSALEAPASAGRSEIFHWLLAPVARLEQPCLGRKRGRWDYTLCFAGNISKEGFLGFLGMGPMDELIGAKLLKFIYCTVFFQSLFWKDYAIALVFLERFKAPR